MRVMANPPPAASADPISTSAKLQAAYVETLLRFEGKSLDRVVAAGGQVRSVLGNIATVDIPISACYCQGGHCPTWFCAPVRDRLRGSRSPFY